MKIKSVSGLGLTALLLATFITGSGAWGSPGASLTISGAGATFPYPLYSKWFSEYRKVDPSVEINYQSIGSGGGIRQALEGTVAFGASDTPMTYEQLSKAKSPIMHLPTVLGAVVLTYNLPELKTPLTLSAELVADIFLGKITQWNDPKIQALNPGVSLPDSSLMVAYRSDGSGTTAVFADYLSKVSPEWKSKVGSGTSLKWPVGLGGKGNEGVTGLVKQTPGAIGYVELIYAESNHLAFASLKNRAGTVVVPSTKSITAAAAGALKLIPADFRVSITDSPSKDAYPISSFTYLLINQKMKGEQGRKIVAFLKWAVTDGQKMAEPLYYAPLPRELVKKIQAKIAAITVD